MSNYRIDDTQTTSEGRKVFIVQYAAGGNVPPQYEFDSLEAAKVRQEELEKEDRALTEKDLDAINRAIEARTKWLTSPDENDKELLKTFSKRHEEIAYQPNSNNPGHKPTRLRWQQSLIDGLSPDRQKQLHAFTKSKELGR